MIDVLTLNYNDSESTLFFVDHIKNYACISHILIVDNKSTDDSILRLKKIESEKVILISNTCNAGYGSGNNLGIQYLKKSYNSNYILLANPDTIVDEDCLIKLESFLTSHKDYAIVAPTMLDCNKKVQYNTAFKIPSLWTYILSFDLFYQKVFKPYYYPDINKDETRKDVDAVSGSMFMMNTDNMLRYGMFDEQVFLYCEELILGIKLKRSKIKTALLRDSFFIHNHSVSIPKTYKSISSKRKLMMDSSLYVLKKYYKASFFAYLVGFVIAKLSILEVSIISLIKR